MVIFVQKPNLNVKFFIALGFDGEIGGLVWTCDYAGLGWGLCNVMGRCMVRDLGQWCVGGGNGADDGDGAGR